MKYLLAFLLLPLTAVADDFPQPYNSERESEQLLMSPEAAAAGMQVPDGFHVSVFAAEPEVQNPIALAWDKQGRMWVAENFTYAERDVRFDLSLRDRVLILEDADNDGRAESRKVFTDQVQMLTSVEVGRGGVWLMCPPQLLYIPDADGDDTPDGPPQVMLDGFTVGPSSHHNFANGLRWGPDGWLYGRCGHSCPGRLGTPGTPNELRVPIEGGIWRYHPEHKFVEVLCHGTVNPWGHDWDRHGELFFINTVIGHLWHMLPGAHFKESFGESLNPAVYERMDMIADHYHFDTTGSWSASRDGKANDYGGGHAHIGMMISQADHWPERYRNRLFTLNMHGRRANVERLERTDAGTGYVGRHEDDFLIAADPWFRGMEISTGPDGNAFVLDWSDTGECHEATGVHRTSGRVFKISYGDQREPQPIVKPSCLRGDGPLPKLWREYQAGETTTEQLRTLLNDPDEHVRVWAIRLLTDLWPLDTIVGPRRDADYPDDPQSRAEFVRLAREDTSGLVHLTLASTLQRLPVPHRAELALALVEHQEYAADRDLPSLVWDGLIPLGDADPAALVEIARHCRWPTLLRWITRNLASHIKTEPEALNDWLSSAVALPPELQKSVLDGLREAFQGWRSAPQPAAWEAFTQTETARQASVLVAELSTLFGDGRALAEIKSLALDDKAGLTTRQAALKSLIDARPPDLRSICESLLNVRILNSTAVRGLAQFDDPAIGQRLARSYHRFAPDERPAVLDTLVSRPTFAAALLQSIGDQKGDIPRRDVTAFHARQIRSFEDETLNRKLTDTWGQLRDSPAERQELIEKLRGQLQPVALQQADLGQGRALYRKSCAACHTLFGDGGKIGPDLTGSQRANLDYVLSNIIDPGAVVPADYRMSVLVVNDGRVLNGIVAGQNEQSLTLKTPTETITINLDEIEELQASPASLMPDNLLQPLSPTQIRDLIAYLMHPVQVPLPDGDQKSE